MSRWVWLGLVWLVGCPAEAPGPVGEEAVEEVVEEGSVAPLTSSERIAAAWSRLVCEALREAASEVVVGVEVHDDTRRVEGHEDEDAERFMLGSLAFVAPVGEVDEVEFGGGSGWVEVVLRGAGWSVSLREWEGSAAWKARLEEASRATEGFGEEALSGALEGLARWGESEGLEVGSFVETYGEVVQGWQRSGWSGVEAARGLLWSQAGALASEDPREVYRAGRWLAMRERVWGGGEAVASGPLVGVERVVEGRVEVRVVGNEGCTVDVVWEGPEGGWEPWLGSLRPYEPKASRARGLLRRAEREGGAVGALWWLSGQHQDPGRGGEGWESLEVVWGEGGVEGVQAWLSGLDSRR